LGAQVKKMSLQSVPLSTVVQQGKTLIWSTRNGTKAATATLTASSEARAAKGIGVIVAVFVISWLNCCEIPL